MGGRKRGGDGGKEGRGGFRLNAFNREKHKTKLE